jgi:hypothetical protein
MYESKTQAPLPRAGFAWRLLLHVFLALGLLVASLGVGMLGYCRLERLSLLDAFLNSAMLLGGMGPVDPPATPGGKLFAGLYALYAGLVFIVAAALIFTPIAHRVLHKFHWGEELGEEAGAPETPV